MVWDSRWRAEDCGVGDVRLLGQCRNSTASLCNPQFTGPMCMACNANYFQLGASCVKCPDDQAGKQAVAVLGPVCVVIFWIVFNKVLVEEFDAVDLLTIYMQVWCRGGKWVPARQLLMGGVQVGNSIGQFNLNWPGQMSVFYSIFSIVNFDVRWRHGSRAHSPSRL